MLRVSYLRCQSPRILLPLLLFLACAWVPAHAAAQVFETAAIHPSQVRDQCTNILPPGTGRFEMTCVPLRALVELAYQPDTLRGPDAQLDMLYDVRATTPGAAPWTMKSVQPMLQALLVERFHLLFHSQAESVAGYELVVGPHGSRLKAAPAQAAEIKNGVGTTFLSAGRVAGRGLTLASIASLFGLAEQSHIVDGTGLQGTFDIDLRYAPEETPTSDLPQFSTAIKEQLGLELKRARVPITVMVLDHVDQTPVEN